MKTSTTSNLIALNTAVATTGLIRTADRNSENTVKADSLAAHLNTNKSFTAAISTVLEAQEAVAAMPSNLSIPKKNALTAEFDKAVTAHSAMLTAFYPLVSTMSVSNIGSAIIESSAMPVMRVNGYSITPDMVLHIFLFGLKTKLHNSRKPTMSEEEKAQAMQAQLEAFCAGYPTISDHEKAMKAPAAPKASKATSAVMDLPTTMLVALRNKAEADKNESLLETIKSVSGEAVLASLKANNAELYEALKVHAEAIMEKKLVDAQKALAVALKDSDKVLGELDIQF